MSASSPDELALAAIQAGRLVVDTTAGTITRHGHRAEHLDPRTGYGRVAVASPLRWAMAHRVVWIAQHGLIPGGRRTQLNHANRKRWDNRIANLELVLPQGNQLHWRGQHYERLTSDQYAEAMAAYQDGDVGVRRLVLQLDPYGEQAWLHRRLP